MVPFCVDTEGFEPSAPIWCACFISTHAFYDVKCDIYDVTNYIIVSVFDPSVMYPKSFP